MACAGTGQITDSTTLILNPVQKTWETDQPWLGYYYRDNPPVYQYRDGNGAWTTFGTGSPVSTDSIRIRALVPSPNGVVSLYNDRWVSSNILDFTDTTQAWWNSMLRIQPDVSKVFKFQNGIIQALSTHWDTLAVTSGDTIEGYTYVKLTRTPNLVPKSFAVVPWDLFKNKTYTYLLPNTYSDVLVRDYETETAPDILARVERLDRGYDSLNAQARINRNGIYFYTALNDAGDSLSLIQPPMWNPSAYGYSARFGQAVQLFNRMDTVLSHHYGGRSVWISDSTKKIDIVCHSQGCLDLREALRSNRDPSLGNPLNHIRKVVSLDSPAFGSAFATSAQDLAANIGDSVFSSLDSIRQKLFDTTSELIPDRSTNLQFVAGMAAASAYGACDQFNHDVAYAFGTECAVIGGVVTEVGGILGAGISEGVSAYGSCSDGVGVPVAAQIAGAACGIGAGVVSALSAPFTDFEWSLHGGLLGPYDLRLRTNTFGITTIQHFTDPGPTSLRSLAVNFSDTTRDLSHTSRWINDLAQFRYPTRPIDAAPIPFTVLYSGGTGHIVDTVSQELQNNLNQYCAEHSDDISDNCELLTNVIDGALGTTKKVQNDQTVLELESLIEKLQYQWTEQGDIVVEKSSQVMINRTLGFDPGNSLLHFDTTNYRYQMANGIGGAKYVAHLPIPTVSFNVKGTNMSFNTFRPGAPRMGMDIYAALGYDTGVFNSGVQSLPLASHTLSLPQLNPQVSTSTTATVQQLPVQGNFNVEPLSADSLIQGISLSTGSSSVPSLLAFWDKTQGAFLWVNPSNGTSSAQSLANWGRPVRVRLSRTGNLFTMTVTGLDGSVNVDTITLALPDTIWLGALSSSSVASSNSLRPVLTGQLSVTDSSALIAQHPWNLLVLGRESADSSQSNMALPRFALVNRDTRTLNGVVLYYEFRADPSRNPVLESFQGSGSATLQSLGGDNWRVVINDPQAIVPPGGTYPSASGFGLQLRYPDGSSWPRKEEWSSQGGSGLLYSTNRIQVRDESGKVLTGLEMPLSDSGHLESVVGLARDMGLNSNNQVSPVISVHNSGGVPLVGYHAQWYVRAPVNKTVALQSWYTPDAQATIKSLGDGLWLIDLDFGNHVLYPGQTTTEQQIGLNLSDYSAWDRTGDPTQTTSSQIALPLESMVVVDSSGMVVWGNVLALPDTAAIQTPPTAGGVLPVSAVIRDENPSDDTWIRPRFILTNEGSTTLNGFVVVFPLVVDTGKQILVAPWYAPGCQVGLVATGGKVDTLKYVCQNLAVGPGQIWPDGGGAVVGVQYVDGTLWNRAADPFVTSWTTTFTPTTVLKVEALP
jgi:hypothetical protein